MGYSGSAAYRMPFGRFRRQPLGAVPAGYLEWLASRPDLRPPLRGQVFAELARRRIHVEAEPLIADAPDPGVVADLVRAGRRALAARLHPDVGGDGEHLKLVNATADLLLARLDR